MQLYALMFLNEIKTQHNILPQQFYLIASNIESNAISSFPHLYTEAFEGLLSSTQFIQLSMIPNLLQTTVFNHHPYYYMKRRFIDFPTTYFCHLFDCGYDHISVTSILKRCSDNISVSLFAIFKNCYLEFHYGGSQQYNDNIDEILIPNCQYYIEFGELKFIRYSFLMKNIISCKYTYNAL